MDNNSTSSVFGFIQPKNLPDFFKFDTKSQTQDQSKYFAIGYSQVSDDFTPKVMYAFGDVMPENILLDVPLDTKVPSNILYPTISRCVIDDKQDDNQILTGWKTNTSVNTPFYKNTEYTELDNDTDLKYLLFVRNGRDVTLIGAFDNTGQQYAYDESGDNMVKLQKWVEADLTNSQYAGNIKNRDKLQKQKNEFYESLNNIAEKLKEIVTINNIQRDHSVDNKLTNITTQIKQVNVKYDIDTTDTDLNAKKAQKNQASTFITEISNKIKYCDEANKLVDEITKMISHVDTINYITTSHYTSVKELTESITQLKNKYEDIKKKLEKTVKDLEIEIQQSETNAQTALREAKENYIKQCISAIPTTVEFNSELSKLRTIDMTPNTGTNPQDLASYLKAAREEYSKYTNVATKISEYFGTSNLKLDNMFSNGKYNNADNELLNEITNKFKAVIAQLNTHLIDNTGDIKPFTFDSSELTITMNKNTNGDDEPDPGLIDKFNTYITDLRKLIDDNNGATQNPPIAITKVELSDSFNKYLADSKTDLTKRINELYKSALALGDKMITQLQAYSQDITSVDVKNITSVTKAINAFEKIRNSITEIEDYTKYKCTKATTDISILINEITDKIQSLVQSDTEILKDDTHTMIDIATQKIKDDVTKAATEAANTAKQAELAARNLQLQSTVESIKNASTLFNDVVNDKSKKLIDSLVEDF
jgi:hypothetical protein